MGASVSHAFSCHEVVPSTISCIAFGGLGGSGTGELLRALRSRSLRPLEPGRPRIDSHRSAFLLKAALRAAQIAASSLEPALRAENLDVELVERLRLRHGRIRQRVGEVDLALAHGTS